MLIYRLFNGKEFDNEKEYEDNLKKLMNTKIIDFSEYELNCYINEYFSERFRNSQRMVAFKSVKNNETYLKVSDDAISISVDRYNDKKYVALQFITNISCDDKFKDYYNLYSNINLTTNYLLDGEILLRDFEKEVMKILKKVCNNWLQYEIKDISKMLNNFINEK